MLSDKVEAERLVKTSSKKYFMSIEDFLKQFKSKKANKKVNKSKKIKRN